MDDGQHEYDNELSRIEAQSGKYITDALMLKCATNAKTKDKKELLKKEGRSIYF